MRFQAEAVLIVARSSLERLLIPGTTGSTTPTPEWLSRRVRLWLQLTKRTPWEHQAEAWTAVHDGFDVLLTTPTGSGKTLSFGVPVLDYLVRNPSGVVLLLYPSRALSRDQEQTFQTFLQEAGIPGNVAVVDGDVQGSSRLEVLNDPNTRIILSNPHTIHANLVRHDSWSRLWSNVGMIVIDELHAYNGVLGTHVAWVMRRMFRIIAHYQPGRTIPIMAASATLDSPRTHFNAITGRGSIYVVERSTATTPDREWIVVPAGPNSVSALVSALAVVGGSQILVYCNSRSKVESLATALQATFPQLLIERYRSGLSKGDRQRIEGGLRSGTVRVVVTTSALAAGIDVGSLDAVIMADVPSDIATLRQVAGRAGRRGQKAHIAIVAPPDTPMGNLLCQPNGLSHVLTTPLHSSARLDNPVITPLHVRLAAQELPLVAHDNILVGNALTLLRAIYALRDAHELTLENTAWVPTQTRRPFSLLTGVDTPSVMVSSSGETLESISIHRSMLETYPGAHLNLAGDHWVVTGWEPKSKKPTPRPPVGLPSKSVPHAVFTTGARIMLKKLAPSDPDYGVRTKPSRFTSVLVGDTISEVPSRWGAAIHDCIVWTSVGGYQRWQDYDLTKIIYDMPLGASYSSRALVINTRKGVNHGFLHALLNSAVELAGVTLGDIAEVPRTNSIIIHDIAGPTGSVDLLGMHLDECISSAVERLHNCACGGTGCLACMLIPNGCSEIVDRNLAIQSVQFLLPSDTASASPEAAPLRRFG